MTPKHTHVKGPWVIQRDYRYDQDAYSIERKGDGLRSIVALMNDNWVCEEHGDLLSTARLIAAAPDMLQAVKDALEVISSPHPDQRRAETQIERRLEQLIYDIEETK